MKGTLWPYCDLVENDLLLFIAKQDRDLILVRSHELILNGFKIYPRSMSIRKQRLNTMLNSVGLYRQ